MPHNIMQKVNSFALRAFRDTADKDYIHARMAYKAKLFPQFQWSSLHALEKYAKCILILTRVPKSNKQRDYIGHEVNKSLDLIASKLEVELSEQTLKFISKLESFGARFRYLEVSWFINDCELTFLDRAVWELRRFCNAELFNYQKNEFVSVNLEKYKKVKSIDQRTNENTLIPGGFLEKVLENKKENARSSLVWCNLFYSVSNRKHVKIPTYRMAENAPFYLYPEIIDEVSKYTFIPKDIKDAYRNN